MAKLWRGVIVEYADRIPDYIQNQIVTLQEGGTPLIAAPALSARTGANVFVKYEGLNPTGSFKDRGMTAAISAAAGRGAKAVICASTGNTSASAAAYATRAGMVCAVLVPEGKIAMGKLSQAIAHGAKLLQVDGNFDDCLAIARELAENHPVELVNSVNPARIEGQKTAAFEIVDVLGDAPDIHCLPVGNAGNITAYWKGFTEYAAPEFGVPAATKRPQMWGFQAAGAAPIVLGHPVDNPETIATAIRIGHPASWQQAISARDESGGVIEAVSDEQILAAHRLLSREVGVFVEPASAAGVAGLLQRAAAGLVPAGATITITVTGHGLKDPSWALREPDGSEVTPKAVAADADAIATELELDWELFHGKVKVLVPATSGNIGPGFDCLGLAYEFYDQVEVRIVDGPTIVTVEGEGAGTVPLDARHLVLRALRRTLEATGMPQPNLHLHCLNRIPHGRGLGSSAAAVVAGITAARGLLPDPAALPLARVLELATEFEGHPDNAAPAIYGGATVSWMDRGQPFAVKIPVSRSLRPILLVPNKTLATKAARAVLPGQVPFGDAVFNIGRVALLTSALNAAPQYLFTATQDKLHQPYRASVMPESAALVEKLRSDPIAIPAVVSGAGPTVLVLGTGSGEVMDGESGAEMFSELGKRLDFDLTGWRVLPLAVDEKGALFTRELA